MKAEKIAKDILAEMKDKKASPYCQRFKHTCYLPHPQPECEECRYFNAIRFMRDQGTLYPAPQG